MISEQDFKLELTKNLKGDFSDGDLIPGNDKRADLVSDKIKMAIEIKDDILLKINKNGTLETASFNKKQKGRQLKSDFRNANLKFKNIVYKGYKTILIIRTETIDISLNVLKNHIINDFWKELDNSITEVGGCLFWGNNLIYYVENKSPNIVIFRKVKKEEILYVFHKYNVSIEDN